MNGAPWLIPLIVATGIAAIGWMVRYILTSITDKLDDLESTFTKVAGELEGEHRKFMDQLAMIDRRVIRLESWRDLIELLEHGPGHGL